MAEKPTAAPRGDEDFIALKTEILQALSHPEASEGLYFRNFYHLHEEDERAAVDADPTLILAALYDLIDEGKVAVRNEGEEATFHLLDDRSSGDPTP